ncbi:S8 family serine peptidase [Pseudaquabacterium terrae]|uniref:S8 family serine peptidase n=1 Tax=Pseudaquabacterium terrae TaxID=2732868 RepID=UPI0031B5885E
MRTFSRPSPLPTLLAAALAALTLCGPATAQEATDWAKGRLLVMSRAGLSADDLDKAVKPHGGKARRIGNSDLHIVDLPAHASETAVQAQLKHHPHLKFAELDRKVSAAMAVNDPYTGSAWHLNKIGAPTAWDSSQGLGVTIAILDSGVSATHADLAANLVPGWNFIDNNNNTADVHGHGTAVAGAAAAATNNAVGVAAVAGRAKIMPVRIADANAYAYWSTVAQGLTWAADNGARVANISYVGVAGSLSVQNAAQYMKNKGGLVVVCAGNNNIAETIAPTTTMIPVSATDSNDAKSSFSSWGNFVALSAPGTGIWTTTRAGGYGAWNGTSFASPIVAGAAALAMAANPALTGSQVEALLYSSSVDLGAAGRDAVYGHGRLNVAAAVAAALATPAPDTTAPTIGIINPLASASVSGVVPVDVQASDNVGVTKVELRVNGSLVATDTSAPFAFSWNSATVSNGMKSLVATAYDAAGNSKASTALSVNVANAVVADTTPPVVTISNPVAGSRVLGNVQITLAASDNAGAAGITQKLYIDGTLKATGTGSSLSYTWNTRKVATGTHTLRAEARDAAGNTSSVTVSVSN